MEFVRERGRLIGLAYRMLGSRAEAEDAVQEAWLRYRATERSTIDDLPAWLTTVTARICLDQLRSARVRREAYVGPWLPEPLVARLPGPGGADGFAADPADRVEHLDEVSYALLVVMERLSPEQRVAFVLHDIFAVPYDEIARVLSGTPAAARQLASRARRAIADAKAPRHRTDRAEQRRLVAAFVAAAEAGDINGLLAVLAPDVVALGDGGGMAPAARHPVVGAVRVARFILGLVQRFMRGPAALDARAAEGDRPSPAGEAGPVVEPVLINGEPGLLADVTFPDGRRLRLTTAFAVADGRITGIFNQFNPVKLAGAPAPDPRRALRL